MTGNTEWVVRTEAVQRVAVQGRKLILNLHGLAGGNAERSFVQFVVKQCDHSHCVLLLLRVLLQLLRQRDRSICHLFDLAGRLLGIRRCASGYGLVGS